MDLARTAGKQLTGEFQADATIGTGDQDNSILDFHGGDSRKWGKQTHLILMTTLPFARPVSTCAMASLVDSNGKTLSSTGRIAPLSMSGVI